MASHHQFQCVIPLEDFLCKRERCPVSYKSKQRPNRGGDTHVSGLNCAILLISFVLDAKRIVGPERFVAKFDKNADHNTPRGLCKHSEALLMQHPQNLDNS
jgi:hypothetical protein